MIDHGRHIVQDLVPVDEEAFEEDRLIVVGERQAGRIEGASVKMRRR
jgi:hypothetical protein